MSRQVVLRQNPQRPNIWMLKDVANGELLDFHVDGLAYNGAFAADAVVGDAIRKGYEIVGVIAAEQERLHGDTNLSAAEGALYRAHRGAWDRA